MWLVHAIGAVDRPDDVRAVGRKTLLAATRRIYEPGVSSTRGMEGAKVKIRAKSTRILNSDINTRLLPPDR